MVVIYPGDVVQAKGLYGICQERFNVSEIILLCNSKHSFGYLSGLPCVYHKEPIIFLKERAREIIIAPTNDEGIQVATALHLKTLYSTAATLNKLLNKSYFLKLLGKIDPSVIPRNFNIEDFQLPCIYKPNIGTGSRGVLKIESRDELENLDLIEGRIEEYLSGDSIQYKYDVLCIEESIEIWGTRKLGTFPKEIGSFAYGDEMSFLEIRSSKALVKFLKEYNLKGFFDFDLLLSKDGGLKFIECNPRVPASLGVVLPRIIRSNDISLSSLRANFSLTVALLLFKGISIKEFFNIFLSAKRIDETTSVWNWLRIAMFYNLPKMKQKLK